MVFKGATRFLKYFANPFTSTWMHWHILSLDLNTAVSLLLGKLSAIQKCPNKKKKKQQNVTKKKYKHF